MKSPERDEYIRYRIEKAEEAFEAAELLADHKKWNAELALTSHRLSEKKIATSDDHA